ncbi:hypothetical protein BJX68DRAFT_271570 [Aspergillus pseudodeflectus]|uniref:Uncharacterized protein n=1 Tax=Aspergillus pseudodeflectus TaxID=176178 RepID=A0ABR4JKP5_9EURO
MNALKPTTPVDIMFIETTDPACVMFVWTCEGKSVHPASFLTIRFQKGQYVENSYLEEGGIPDNGKADPFHKPAHWIASIPASKLDYYRKMVRLSLPHLGDWSVNVLLDPLRREGFLDATKAKEVEGELMKILAANRGVVLKEADEKAKEEAKKKNSEKKA